VHHTPVIEGKVVIAPASISSLGRAEIPAGAALLDQTGELIGQRPIRWLDVDRRQFTGQRFRLLDLRPASRFRF
jgi:hypothetical protein